MSCNKINARKKTVKGRDSFLHRKLPPIFPVDGPAATDYSRMAIQRVSEPLSESRMQAMLFFQKRSW